MDRVFEIAAGFSLVFIGNALVYGGILLLKGFKP